MTAVKTLLDWLSKNHYYIGNDLLEKVEELNELEKQQIIDAHFAAQMEDIRFWAEAKQEALDYYNETFKSE